jgi:hypothetical protein
MNVMVKNRGELTTERVEIRVSEVTLERPNFPAQLMERQTRFGKI